MPIETENARMVQRRDFGRLLEALQARGYTVVGPTLRDQAIVYEELEARPGDYVLLHVGFAISRIDQLDELGSSSGAEAKT